MQRKREALLHDAATLYMRAAGILELTRLQIWEALGVSLPQLRILFRVRSEPGIDVSGLAEAFGISPSAASQQVDKLVSRSLLLRTDDPHDRRRLRLDLTEIGQQAAGEISRIYRGRATSVVEALNDDEIAQLLGLLDRMLAPAPSTATAPA